MKKLTLSAEEDVIEQARQIADRENTSISAIFSNFIRSIANPKKSAADIPANSIAVRATGMVALPKGKSSRDILTDALMEKYSGRK